MFAVSLLSILTNNNIDYSVTDRLKAYYSDDFNDNMLYNIFYSAVSNASSGTTIITAVVSLWTAGRGLYIITDGINRIYRLPYKRIWLIKRIYAMGYTVVMLIMMIITLTALSLGLMFSTEINSLFKIYMPFWFSKTVFYIVGDLLMGLSMVIALKMYLWRKIPDKRYSKVRVLVPGVTITVLGWNLLMFGVSVYTKYFTTSSVYGSLGTVAIFMMMIYFMMFILLCGMQFNYIYRRQLYSFSFKKLFKRCSTL